MTPEEFIAWLMPVAAEVCAEYDLPPSVCVAQAAIESGWGRYTSGAYNFFGRKYGGSGSWVEMVTEEFLDDQWVEVMARFQSYESLEEAVRDWCVLMTEEPVYGRCLYWRRNPAAFVASMAPIYATDPDYQSKVWSTIVANGMVNIE
mgnify:CR=1 FL=1